jgi:uncharacterized membrane protein
VSAPADAARGARAAAPIASAGLRLAAIDWMRGAVMVLMAIDHASQTWNAGRLNADSAYLLNPATGAPLWLPGSPLPLDQFLTRWITHLCAPTFLFLSGTSLAMSLERRAKSGMRAAELDRHLLIRGLVVLAGEAYLSALMGGVMLQVLYAIGASLLAMIALRRLPTRALLAGALAWLAGGELVTRALVAPGEAVPLPLALFFAPSFAGPVMVLYPLLGWLAMLVLGWCFGRYLLDVPSTNEGRARAEGLLLRAGLAALLLFALVRGLDGYGNMGLHRDDASLAQWLHVSKYPPALAYSALELGLLVLGLAGSSALERRLHAAPWRWNPLLLFGQSAYFFYLVHFLVLGGSAMAITGGIQQRGLSEAYLAALGTLIVLYPVCCAWRAFKQAHPRSFAQYI